MHTAFGCGNLVSYSCWKTGISIMLVCVDRRWKISIPIKVRPGVAQRVGRGIALLFHDRGTRRG